MRRCCCSAERWWSRHGASGGDTTTEPARWWTIRRAQNSKPATYRCPLCNGFLPALSEHVLIAPEGDTRRRRHAHTECAAAARRAGRLPTRDEWRKLSGERPPPGPLARLAKRLRRAP